MQHRKYNRRWFLLALIFISIAANIYIRLNPLFLPNLKEAAALDINTQARNRLDKEVSAKYPALPDSARQKLLDALFKEYVKENRTEMNKAIAQKNKELKSFYQDERGWTYLSEIDPYRWQRRVESFINTGHFGTRLKDGRQYDDLMFAPFGARIEPLKIHYYIGAYFYKFLHLLNPELSLANCLALIPIVLSAVMVIAAFSVCLLLGVSYGGSFITSLYLGLSLFILHRSSFGRFDTDLYNIIFPLGLLLVLAHSFKSKGIRHCSFLCLGGLLVGIYSSVWAIWWLAFYILLSGILFYKLEIIFYEPKISFVSKVKDSFFSLSVFVGISYLCVLLISGPEAVKKSFSEPLTFFFLRENLTRYNFWPSVVFTIGELRRVNFKTIIACVGGPFAFFGGIFGLLLLIIFKKAPVDFKEKRPLILMLFIWLAATLILAYFAVRFIIFLIIPIAICLGALWDFFVNLTARLKKRLRVPVLAFTFTIIVISPINNGLRQVDLPFMNRAWQGMLAKIKEITPANAIINTWWDEGDYIMTIAKRATVHDASWQHEPVTYWMARVFLAKDEKEAAGILRMIDSGANQAFEQLNAALNDQLLTFETINKMLLLDKEGSRVLLGAYLKDKDKIDRILSLMYGPPRPGYLLVESNMPGILKAFARIGSWDFRKLDLWQKFLKLKEDEFIGYAQKRFTFSQDYTRQIYKALTLMDKADILSWLSSEEYRIYSHSTKANKASAGRMLLFDNCLVVDKEGIKGYFHDGMQEKWIIPRQVNLMTGNEIKESVNDEGDALYSLFLAQKQDQFKAVLSSKMLAESLFFKLFFTQGNGLKYFKLAHHEEKNNFHLYLYKINWDIEEGSK